jgi:hypothetical protein
MLNRTCRQPGAEHPLCLEGEKTCEWGAMRTGQAHRFRYLLDGERWENDHAADAYVPNPYRSDDSVVQL